jgi:hypothetical protein
MDRRLIITGCHFNLCLKKMQFFEKQIITLTDTNFTTKMWRYVTITELWESPKPL